MPDSRPAPWANSRSCTSRRWRSSTSRRSTLASAASSDGSTATMLSSMSASTCWRSDAGRDWMKLAGSSGASLLSRFWSAANLDCSALCCASTWKQHQQFWPKKNVSVKNDTNLCQLVLIDLYDMVGRYVYLYSALFAVHHTRGTQAWITQFYLQLHQCLPLPRKRSPDGASPDWVCTHLIAAYYSFIYPKTMKGWVGLVDSPTADGLPTHVLTHQLQVKSRIGKVRRSKTNVLPLYHATNFTSRIYPLAYL